MTFFLTKIARVYWKSYKSNQHAVRDDDGSMFEKGSSKFRKGFGKIMQMILSVAKMSVWMEKQRFWKNI